MSTIRTLVVALMFGLAAADIKPHATDSRGRWRNAEVYRRGAGPMHVPTQQFNSTPIYPATIPRFVTELPLPAVMPASSHLEESDARTLGAVSKDSYYEISSRPTLQQVLPSGYARTQVYAYGPASDSNNARFSWPAMTIETQANKPIRVKWINELKDSRGNCVPHLTKAVDATLHWANPPGGASGRDMNPCASTLTTACMVSGVCNATAQCQAAASGPYTGPVPNVVHLHGLENAGDDSDGHPEAWYLPANCKNLPAGYATEGSWYAIFKNKSETLYTQKWTPGSAVFNYPNAQTPATLWYHDHTIGMTRLNVVAGLEGYYFIRPNGVTKPDLPKIPFPPPGGDAALKTAAQLRELPLVIQDRAFTQDGSILYPFNDIGDRNSGAPLPNGPYAPLWIPEYFPTDANGTSLAAMIVNGKTWPKASVARSAYRLRLLNGCNARTLKVSFSLSPPPTDGSDTRTTPTERIPFWVIGSEAGFLSKPVQMSELLMGPAERFDIIFDFKKPELRGKSVYMRNSGPEGPFGSPTDEYDAPPEYTAQVMRFDVASTSTVDNRFSDGSDLVTGVTLPDQGTPSVTRTLALFEGDGADIEGPNTAEPLGQSLSDFQGDKLIVTSYSDEVTTNPMPGTTEDWVLINLTPDGHPIHIHKKAFSIVKREAIEVTVDSTTGAVGYNVLGLYNETVPEELKCTTASGLCLKDTVIVYPGTATTVRIKFPGDTATKKAEPGLFVWHCHLLEHEDNEMMRPFCFGQPGYTNPKTGKPMCPGGAASGRKRLAMRKLM